VALQLRLQIVTAYNREMQAGRLHGYCERIAKELHCSKPTVSRALAAAHVDLHEQCADVLLDAKRGVLARLDAELERLKGVEAEITEQWHRSKQDEQSTTIEQDVVEMPDPNDKTKTIRRPSGTGKVKKFSRGQSGQAAYTAQLIALSAERRALDKQRRELLGLDAPTKVAPTTPDGVSPITFTLKIGDATDT
jgi:hypothetical protein